MVERALWDSHNVNMCPGRSSPHDVGACWLMCRGQPCCFRIEGPQDHPVRPNGNRRARLVERVRVTRCVAPANMYSMPGTVVLGLALWCAKSLFHCIATLSAHIAGIPVPVGSPGMQVKSFCPFTQDLHPSIRIDLGNRSFVRNVGRTGRKCLLDFFYRRFLRVGALSRRCKYMNKRK